MGTATSGAGRGGQRPPVELFVPSNNPDYQTHKVSESEVVEDNSREGSLWTSNDRVTSCAASSNYHLPQQEMSRRVNCKLSTLRIY